MTCFHPNDPPALALAAHVGEQLSSILQESTIPIVGFNDAAFQERGGITLVDDKPMMLMGTGSLFRVGSLSMIVTAAHVIGDIEKLHQSPSIPIGNPPSPMPIHGQRILNDELDLAILILPSETSNELSDRRFLQLNTVDFRPVLDDGWYFLHGYPFVDSIESKDRLTTTISTFTHRTALYKGSGHNLENFNPNFHILLDCSAECRFADDGSPAPFPKSLTGMSGSSIWAAFSFAKHIADEWTPEHAKVVAVQSTAYPDKKLVKGTRWTGVAMMLSKEFPKLRDEIASSLRDAM